MLESLNDWSLILERKKSIDVIYFGFAKAFDRIVGVAKAINEFIEIFADCSWKSKAVGVHT
ncbi:hypothetical protein ANCDUO_01245 [Ancylostoma duodenale]|uniref:Uncharacterized protein n=1 Tax=Ancylostoma duodenale TaxID=51022 RepID=A0A0C2H3M1_9BILA|nr:hypothetical protein ANCDUO_01245 [Ancylostoma duodenale]